MKYDPKIDEFLRRGSKFDFDHNSKWNENGQFCNPGVELLAWIAEVKQFVVTGYGECSAPGELVSRFDVDEGFTYACSDDEFCRHISYLLAALTACKQIAPKQKHGDGEGAVECLNAIFKSFHRVAVRLQARHENRETLEINDEYDVQDLLAALLRLRFTDVREEECVPSCAGAGSRIDFILKDAQIAIETKMTRKGLSDKEIGSQLIEDIKRYRSHPSCKRLMCFIYDKDERIRNPQGLKNDLSESGDFNVDVFISPER